LRLIHSAAQEAFMDIRFNHFGKLLCVSLLLVPPAFSQAVVPGEKWRVKSSASMSGMSMPSQTQEMCQPKADKTAAPVPTQSNCRMSDMKQVGNKSSMKMTCTGEHPMTAVIESEYFGPDHYKGSMQSHFDASQVGPGGPPGGTDMTMNYEGENLHVACNAAEPMQSAATVPSLPRGRAAEARAAEAKAAGAKAEATDASDEAKKGALQKTKDKLKGLLNF
jgi:hypothetical protein